MKTFYRLFIMLAVVCWAGIVSCSKDPDVDNNSAVVVDRSTLDPGKGGAIYDLNIKANCHWAVTIPSDAKRWIKVTPSEGMGNGLITIDISANTTTDVRRAELIVGSLNEHAGQPILISQAAGSGGGGTGDGVELPVCAVFLNQSNDVVTSGASNGVIADNAFQFESGVIIEREGGDAGLAYAWQKQYYEVVLNTTNWDAPDAAWLLTIPMLREVSGDLKLMFGARLDSADPGPGSWQMEWSSDKTTWTAPANCAYGVSSSDRFKTLWFSIPQDQQIAAGGTLYIRLKPTDVSGVKPTGVVRLDSGVVLMDANIPQGDLPTGEKVLYTCGFDDAREGIDYLLPVWYMKSAFGGNYTPSDGATVSSVRMCHGAVSLGTGSGAGSVTTPALEKLGDYTADLKVTCKAVVYLAATGNSDAFSARIEVAAGPGEIDGAVNGKADMTNLNNETFVGQTFYVRGANKTTKIRFTNDKGGRYILDDIAVEIEGDPIVSDDPVAKKIEEIVALKSNITGSAPAYTIATNYTIKGVVVSDAVGANYPTTAFALVDAATANAGIRVVTTAAHAFKVGEEVEVNLKNGVLSLSNGVLQVKPAADDKIKKTATAAVVPAAKTVTAAELASGDYMSMLVSVADCQVVSGDLSKKMSGAIGMETRDKAGFSLSTLVGAAFANDNAPQLSGVVKGLAGSGAVVMPRTSDDLSGMVLERFGDAPIVPFTPVVNIYRTNGLTGDAAVCTNGSASGSKFTFSDNGAVIERKDGAGVTWANTTNVFTNYIVSSGWTAPNAAYVFTIPTADEISGEMRFSFGMICETSAAAKTAPKTWMVEWSGDGQDWTLVDATYQPSYDEPTTPQGVFDISGSATYKMAIFMVPAAKKIPAGGKLYMRVRPENITTAVAGEVTDAGTVRIQCGFYLAANVRGMYHTSKLPAVGGTTILAEGFDDGVRGHDYLLGLDHMSSQASYSYTPPTGWIAANTTIRPGYIYFTKSKGGGTFTTAPLTALGSTPTEITVKFKACIYQAATGTNDTAKITVTADGVDYDADVSSLESDAFAWHDISVKIPNATQTTTVKILAASGRMFFDELVITK